jgi:carbon-monoxide dehydrogenase large subunit
VDPQTGRAAIERYTMVDDFGRAMNPKLLEGQVQAARQGIGQARFEHAVYGTQGQLLSGSFMDSCIPRAQPAANGIAASTTCRA